MNNLSKNSILLIEDEENIRSFIFTALKNQNYKITTAGCGEEGLHLSASLCPDLILLDLGLPDLDGMEVIRKLRSWSAVPIIVISARTNEHEKARALDLGADDYITKPFSMRELMARVKANMRRTVSAEAEAPAAAKEGKLVISPEQSAVYKNGKPLDLSVREYDILNYLSKTPGRVVTREELMEKVWGYEYYGDLRAVDVAIRRLREKVEDEPAQPKYIITKRGMGYYYPEQP